MAAKYWMVSLLVQGSAFSLWNRLEEQISKQSFDTSVYRFNIPNLRVGTLDSLISLSDDLTKSKNSFVEGVSHKIRRQIEELEKISGVESNVLTVDGVPVDSYRARFVWDEAKYPTMSPLREIVDSIRSQVSKIEDNLKVPRSSKKLYEGNEYALYTATLFSRVGDHFKTTAREKGFQIREFEYSPEAQESRPDHCCEAKEEHSNKIQTLEVVDTDSCHPMKNGENGDHQQNDEHIDDNHLVDKGKGKGGEVGADVDEGVADDDEDDEEDYEDEDDDGDEEDDDSEDGEKSSGKVSEDRKGKGIMKDDKGKGKLIEEDDDDEDSSDGGSDLDLEESDLSDDPLAEVDLDNILPSRTRKRKFQPGVYFTKDLGNDDDDSSDSDA